MYLHPLSQISSHTITHTPYTQNAHTFTPTNTHTTRTLPLTMYYVHLHTQTHTYKGTHTQVCTNVMVHLQPPPYMCTLHYWMTSNWRLLCYHGYYVSIATTAMLPWVICIYGYYWHIDMDTRCLWILTVCCY